MLFLVWFIIWLDGVKLDISVYQNIGQLVVDEEVPLIEDIQRLLSCLRMKWIPQVEVDILNQKKLELNQKIVELQNDLNDLYLKFNESVLHNNKIDEDNLRLRDYLTKSEAKARSLTNELNNIKKEFYDYRNRPMKSEEIQWNIITKSEVPVYDECKSPILNLVVSQEGTGEISRKWTKVSAFKTLEKPLMRLKSIVKIMSITKAAPKIAVKPK